MLNSFVTGVQSHQALQKQKRESRVITIDFNGDCGNIQNKSSSGKTAVQVALIVMLAMIVSFM